MLFFIIQWFDTFVTCADG